MAIIWWTENERHAAFWDERRVYNYGGLCSSQSCGSSDFPGFGLGLEAGVLSLGCSIRTCVKSILSQTHNPGQQKDITWNEWYVRSENSEPQQRVGSRHTPPPASLQ